MRQTLLVVGLSLSVVACHRGAANAPAPALVSHAFGDTATFGLRLLTLDPVDESARARIGASTYLVVLAVRPGRDIELVAPAEHAQLRTQSAGNVSLSLRRYEAPSPDAARDADARAALDYDRCVAAADAAARRQARARTARKDSTGKPIPGSGSSDYIPDRSVGHGCRPVQKKVEPRRLPPREPAERYLVILASSQPIPFAQLNARLETLTAVAPDVATTIEAIAAGLYAGFPGTFAGVYTTW